MTAARAQLSVLLPTRRRPRSLARALAGLAAQVHAPPYELVVVDNDPGGPEPVVPDGAVLVRAPVPGAAAARNAGLAAVTTPLVAMLDDDVVPEPGWLAALTAPVLQGRADATGGRVLLDPAVSRPGWWVPALEGYWSALDHGPHEHELGPADVLVTANLLVRTEQLRAVGGFDERLGHRGGRRAFGEDVAAVRALQAAGARVLWVPGARVVHELPAERLHRRWVLARAYQQGRADWAVDREALQPRVAGGARVALSWWAGQARRRAREGASAGTVLHGACDLARTAGALAEGLSWRGEGRRGGGTA